MSFKDAVIEANKGHLHCHILPPIICTTIIILQAASSLCIIFNYMFKHSRCSRWIVLILFLFFYPSRLLCNRSPVAWGTRRIALGALIFHSNAFAFMCCAPKFSAFSCEGPFKIFLGSSLALIVTLKIKDG